MLVLAESYGIVSQQTELCIFAVRGFGCALFYYIGGKTYEFQTSNCSYIRCMFRFIGGWMLKWNVKERS
jgi:hypothetical protein